MAPPPADTAPIAANPPTVAEAPKPAKEAKAGKEKHYVVVKHDSLWKIAGKKKIYGDPYQWPLLFIANKEKIKDPDIIKPGEKLQVKRNIGADAIADAVKKAKDTPRFQPHTAIREKLPLDY
jgi:nucleoid-associated protein YgaU